MPFAQTKCQERAGNPADKLRLGPINQIVKWRRMKPGDTFGLLTADHYVRTDKNGNAYWIFVCECGGATVARNSHVRSGNVRSCGCLARENVTTHGMSHTPVYNAWLGIRDRCYDHSNKSYPNYGGRGIKVCARWRDSFEAFYEDMGDKPGPNYSLERINNDGDYCPENCRWATKEEQNRNKRSNIIVDVDGAPRNLKAAAQSYGVNYHLVYDRLLRGWDVARALETPARKLTRRVA